MKWITFIVAITFWGCATKHHIYYYDNSKIEKKINKIEGCEGLAEAIRNNFLYNKKTGLYVMNVGFDGFDKYYDCISNLNNEQLIQLFGKPHWIENDNSYYAIKKTTFPMQDEVWFMSFALSETEERRFANQQIGYTKDSITFDLFLEDKNFKRAKFIQAQNDYQAERSEVHKHCYDIQPIVKDELNQEIFYHKKKDYFIVNTWINYQVERFKCLESFTEKEIKGLFGEPTMQSNDTLFYALHDKAFHYDEKRKKSIKEKMIAYMDGKIPCIMFSRKDRDGQVFYRWDTDRVLAERLKK